MTNSTNLSRRNWLRKASLMGAGLVAAPSVALNAAPGLFPAPRPAWP